MTKYNPKKVSVTVNGKVIETFSSEEYQKQYLGNFEPSERDNALYERLEEYYKCTPDSMYNREAWLYLKDFRKWCSDRGYSQEEINLAKRNIQR